MSPRLLPQSALLAFCCVVGASSASAQSDSCSGATNNDQCDRMLFERLDLELTRTIEAKLAAIARRSTYADRVEQARTLLTTAQHEWVKYRDAHCAAQAAEKGLISARTAEGLTAQCLYSITKKRIEELNGS